MKPLIVLFCILIVFTCTPATARNNTTSQDDCDCNGSTDRNCEKVARELRKMQQEEESYHHKMIREQEKIERQLRSQERELRQQERKQRRRD
jgi:predicted ribosome quality control (RQC) complex YloA/Tae2 family protein